MTSFAVPQTASGYSSSNCTDSDEELGPGPSFVERLRFARSGRAQYQVDGHAIGPESASMVALQTGLLAKDPMFRCYLQGVRWNPSFQPNGDIWWTPAGLNERDLDQPRQDFSNGLPLNDDFVVWEQAPVIKDSVSRTALGNPIPSASAVKPTKSLSSRPSKLASASSSTSTIQTAAPKRARTVSAALSTSARSPQRRAIPNEHPVRQPSLPPPPPLPPVARIVPKSSTASSSKLPKSPSSTGSARSTSIYFPVTKRSSISPQELAANAKGGSSTPSTPFQRAPSAARSSPPRDVSGASDEFVRGRASDGRLKGKGSVARTDEPEKDEPNASTVEEHDEEEEGGKMRSLDSWDGMLEADSSAFNLFLPPSFPSDLHSSTPNAKPCPTSSHHHHQLPPPFSSKHKLSDLDGPDAKRKRKPHFKSTPSTSTSSNPTISLLSSFATTLSHQPPQLQPAAGPSKLRPSPVESLAVPSRLQLSRMSSTTSTGTGVATPAEFGGPSHPPSSSGSEAFPWDAVRGSQVEGRFDEIRNFLVEEEGEGGSWVS